MGLHLESLSELFQKLNSLLRVGAAFFRQQCPKKRNRHAFVVDSQIQDVDFELAQHRVGAIHTQHSGIFRGKQTGDQLGNKSFLKSHIGKEALYSAIAGEGFRRTGEGRRELRQIDSALLDEANDQSGQNIQMGLVPIQIRSKLLSKWVDEIYSYLKGWKCVMPVQSSLISQAHFSCWPTLGAHRSLPILNDTLLPSTTSISLPIRSS